MEIVLTNGTCFIKVGDNGKIIKTPEINEADVFTSCKQAKAVKRSAPVKCEKYYLVKKEDPTYKLSSKGRKIYSKERREMIYTKYNGRCALCGRKIKIEDMTLDHIVPLSMGGAESMENLQATCQPCNQFKSNSLPEDFIDRLTVVFMYQMEQKHKSDLSWKMKRTILKMMI